MRMPCACWTAISHACERCLESHHCISLRCNAIWQRHWLQRVVILIEKCLQFSPLSHSSCLALKGIVILCGLTAAAFLSVLITLSGLVKKNTIFSSHFYFFPVNIAEFCVTEDTAYTLSHTCIKYTFTNLYSLNRINIWIDPLHDMATQWKAHHARWQMAQWGINSHSVVNFNVRVNFSVFRCLTVPLAIQHCRFCTMRWCHAKGPFHRIQKKRCPFWCWYCAV